MTVLADGGEDVLHACKLPRPTERVLDWFHIGMRFEHLLVALRGLRHVQLEVKAALAERAEGAKWLLWHGAQRALPGAAGGAAPGHGLGGGAPPAGAAHPVSAWQSPSG